jgi:uncharacterized LabA/DUF88 family protein
MNQKSVKSEFYAVFWDYENVNLSEKTSRSFITSLNNFFTKNQIIYAKVYGQRKNLPAKYETQIKTLHGMKFQWVSIIGKNASDKILITSAMSIVQNKPEITCVVLISGDGDFSSFLQFLKERKIKIITVYRSDSSNLPYITKSNFGISQKYMIKHPDDWWIFKKRPSLDTKTRQDTLIKFCPKCESLLKKKRNKKGKVIFICRCGYSKLLPDISEEADEFSLDSKKYIL